MKVIFNTITYKSLQALVLRLWQLAMLALCGCAAVNALAEEFSPAQLAKAHEPKSTLSGAQKERFELVQRKIKTKDGFLFHEAVVAPYLFESADPFYLLGFEKPRVRNTPRPYCTSNEICDTPQFTPENFTWGEEDDNKKMAVTRQDIHERLFEDSRPLVLTHVLDTNMSTSGARSDEKGCFIFNLYGDDQETAWCKKHYKSDINKPTWKREGWKGLNQLAEAINVRVVREKPTHIILLATGWNTRQYESYLDFKAWMKNIAEDFRTSKTEFRPIYIGIAWESEWPAFAHIPIISLFNKGNDADELGYTWVNYLLNDLIKPIAKETGVPLVIIGHSYGSRIALSSHYVRHILNRNAPIAEVPVTIIGMQAAFPIARFISSHGDEHPYIAANRGEANVVITSSKYDSAAKMMCYGTKYIAANCGIQAIVEDTDNYSKLVNVYKTDSTGMPVTLPDAQKITVYDASPFVNSELPGTNSGAHSDVYDKQMGHFLGEIIRNKHR